MNQPETALVADIGGTNARFALAHRHTDNSLALDEIRVLTVAEHASPIEAARAYLDAVHAGMPGRAVFAVASPVHGDMITFTNSRWTFSIEQLRQALGLPGLRVVNDFAALSMAIPHLAAGDVAVIGTTAPRAEVHTADHRSYAAIGPGTGLGVGGLLIRGGRPVVVESEGGHVAFAPADDYEMAVLRQLWGSYPRVSNERLISGHGLVNLYRAACAIEGVPAALDAPEAIVARADAEPDSICGRTVLRFCAMLGGMAGDVALTLGAWDGVYLGGGIAMKLTAWLARSDFRVRFESKGRHTPLMQKIPTLCIHRPAVGLLGAAAFAGVAGDFRQ